MKKKIFRRCTIKALVDADSLIYKSGFTFEEKFAWNELELELGLEEDPESYFTSDVLLAKNAIDGIMENIKFNTGCDEVELWLTSGHNFRTDVYPLYKSNRKDSRKPTDYNELKAYLISKYKANVATGYEADDVVVYKKTNDPEEYFLCAIDKDVLYQTEGTHYNYNNDEFISITKEEADRFFYYQTLTGDIVDGYPGCPGIGKVKANKILDQAEEDNISYWEAVVDTYKSKGLTEEDALVQARCASMHQFNGTEIELWKPAISLDN